MDPAKGLSEAAQQFAKELSFDAAGAYRAIHQPVLILVGEQDEVFPAKQVVEVARSTISPERLTVRSFPGANHGFLLEAESGDVPRIAPGYFETMLSWSKKQFGMTE